MNVDAFLATPLGSATLGVTAVAQTVLLPKGTPSQIDTLKAGGADVVMTNTGAAGGVIIFVELFNSQQPVVATVANSFPLLGGQSRVFRRGQGDDSVSAIGSAAGPTNLVVSIGTGGL